MLPDKPLDARFTNAQTSPDLKTENGKECSVHLSAGRLHAGHVVVLPAEEMQAFDRFTGEIVAGFAPKTAIERDLARLYAGFQWRIHRAAAIEDTMFGLGILENVSKTLQAGEPRAQNAVSYAMTFRTHAVEFEKISLFSKGLISQGCEVLCQLKQLQAERYMQNQTSDSNPDAADLDVGRTEDQVCSAGV